MQIPAPPSSQKDNKKKNPLSDLGTLLEAARVKNGVPGMSIAVLYKGDIIFADGFGKRNEKDPYTKDTVSLIGSITKSITATAIGELVAEGKMDWDKTPANKYLPEFELKDPALTPQFTMVDLLSHRNELTPNMEVAWLRTKESRRDLIKRLRHAEMAPKLPVYTNYSNVMYAVAGEAAANVAGVSYDDLVKDKVLDRIGGPSHQFGFSQAVMKNLPNHAAPYYADSFEDVLKGEFRYGIYDDTPMAFSPAGDIHSTVFDLLKWGKAVMDGGKVEGKQVLDAKNIAEMLTPHSIVKPGTLILSTKRTKEFAQSVTYGLGWFLDTYKGHNFYHHSGSWPGWRAYLAVFPDDDLVIAQQANIQEAELITYTNYHIADKLLNLPYTQDWLFDVAVKATKKRFGEDSAEEEAALPPQIKNRPSQHPTDEIVGEFDNPLYGLVIVRRQERKVELEKEEDGDVLELLYNRFEAVLEHYHFESFKTTLTDLGSITFTLLVTFETGPDGRVSGLSIGMDEPMHFTKVKKTAEKTVEKTTATTDTETAAKEV
ncbi:hypothetical protein BGX23_002992 [Mortierella sp. AD031]|nr:hypothetical protein BGX23_002992 [Mortierella sp. AD031]